MVNQYYVLSFISIFFFFLSLLCCVAWSFRWLFWLKNTQKTSVLLKNKVCLYYTAFNLALHLSDKHLSVYIKVLLLLINKCRLQNVFNVVSSKYDQCVTLCKSWSKSIKITKSLKKCYYKTKKKQLSADWLRFVP